MLRPVGHGGMGEVFLAYDPNLDRNVALKLVRADRGDVPAFAARLEREARLLAKLAHPNVVRVFDAGTWRAVGFIAMEYLDGESVRSWRATETRSAPEIVRVFAGAARGIGAAHALGIVHRDIKPDNILVGQDGAGRIADFGLAETADASPPRDTAGTAGYHAPEVVAGSPADARSDQWSFCAALFETVTGSLPSVTAMARMPGLPGPLVRALRRGLDADPARRFASMEDLVAALSRPRRLTRYLAIAGVAVTAATLAAVIARSAPSDASDPLAHCDVEAHAATRDAAPLEAPAFHDRFAVFGTAAEARRSATARELTSYTTRLAGVADAACRRAGLTPLATSLQRSCIDDRRRELAALVDQLRDAARPALEQAPLAIAKLPDPELCRDPARLATVIPVEPRLRAEADRIEREITIARSRLLLGERAPLVPIARALDEQANRLGAATVAMATSELLAEILSVNDDPSAASMAFLAAAGHAARARDDRSLALDLVAAAHHAVLEKALERASALLDAAELVAVRAGDAGAVRDALDAASATLAMARGEPTKAVPLRRALVARIAEHKGRTGPHYFTSIEHLAHALRKAGELAEARTLVSDGLAEVAASLGTDHPVAINFHIELGIAAAEAGDLDEARQHHERALAIARSSYGNESGDVASSLANLANVATLQERYADAIAGYQQAIAIRERLPGGQRSIDVTLSSLGAAYIRMNDSKSAIAPLERALANREALFGPTSPKLVSALTNLGQASANTKQLDRARHYWGRCVEIMNQMAAPPPFAADLMRNLADLLEDRGARMRMLADAELMERRIAALTSLSSSPKDPR